MAPPTAPNINTISYPLQVSSSMENSYPGARNSSTLPAKVSFNPLLYRTRHLSLATSKGARKSQDFGSNVELDRGNTKNDYIPLLASAGLVPVEGYSLEDGLSKEEARSKMEGLSQLISRLEDTTSLLRDQLHSAKKTLKGEKNKRRIIKPILPWLLKYQIVIVVLLQICILSLLTIHDVHYPTNKAFGEACLAFLCILQAFNTLLVVLSTYKLSKKLKMGGLGNIMAQTYMSTVIIFAGLYFMFLRLNPETSWDFADKDAVSGNAYAQFVRMLYLSVSSATLCGAANIQPKVWWVTLVVCFQSLMNFVYFASILAQTIGNFHSYTVSVRHRDSILSETLQQHQRPMATSAHSSYSHDYGTMCD